MRHPSFSTITERHKARPKRDDKSSSPLPAKRSNSHAVAILFKKHRAAQSAAQARRQVIFPIASEAKQ